MAAVDLGTEHTLVWAARSAGAALAVEVVRPDGQRAAAVVDQEQGKATVLADMAGRWRVRWTSAAPVSAYTDIFDVWPEDPRFLISLDDAAEGLNAARASESYLADLRLYVAAATPVIEDITGPVLAGGRTWSTGGVGREAVILPEIPSAITAVEVDGHPVADWWLEYGVLHAGSRAVPGSFGAGTLTVAYTVGGAVIPPNIRLAARELVRHWVQIGKQAVGPTRGMEFSDDVYTPSGFAVPRRVVELCAPHQQIGGFA